jgi:hypothetical protein
MNLRHIRRVLASYETNVCPMIILAVWVIAIIVTLETLLVFF